MASNEKFVAYLLEQLSSLHGIRHKKMFGEYALYQHDKVVALVCDDQLFVKPTDAGRQFIGDVELAPAYPGAKSSFLITDLDDSAWLCQLIQLTAAALPAPKVKKVAVKKSKT
jgi:TfoX/Sxy family transcriptional regulator of competence genes